MLSGAALLLSALACPVFSPAAEATAPATAAAAAAAVVDTLVVTAETLEAADGPATSSLVTRIDLEDEPDYRSTAELLGAVAGFQVLRTGAYGSSAVPSLRGSTAGQIRFFLDGVPLGGARTGTAPLENLPLERVAALEIHRGVVPTDLGGIGGVGAVNLVTEPTATPSGVGVHAGAFGALGGRAVWSGARGSLDGTVLVHGRRADNLFTFVDHNQTFHRTDDDRVRQRENAWLEQWGAWGAGRWVGETATVRVSAGHRRRDGGRPGPLGYESPNASVRYERTDAQIHLGLREESVRVLLAASRSDDRLNDPAAEVGLGPAGTSRSKARDLTARLQWSGSLVPGLLDASVQVEGRGQWGTESFRDVTDPENARKQGAAAAAFTVQAAGGRLLVTPSWRWQRTRDDFPPPPPAFPTAPVRPGGVQQRDDVSPAVGVVWETVPSTLFLEAHAARTVRLPSWTELFGLRGGIDGNPGLVPESIESADLALSWRSGTLIRTRLAVFHAETDDKIIFRQNSQRTSRAENIGRTRARGLELEAAAALPAGFELRANGTWQRAEDVSGDPAYDGKRLPFLPDGEAHGRLTWERGGWRPWIEAAWMSANYRDRYNTELNRAPARTLLNLGLSRWWSPSWLGPGGRLTASAEVVNLTDNDVYDVEGFPLPGRTWHLAVKVNR